jgi:hypothetical protein
MSSGRTRRSDEGGRRGSGGRGGGRDDRRGGGGGRRRFEYKSLANVTNTKTFLFYIQIVRNFNRIVASNLSIFSKTKLTQCDYHYLIHPP